jgi:hypothetical protein
MKKAMKSYISLTAILLGVLSLAGCENKSSSDLQCNEIKLNQPFTALIGEDWCIPATGWKINFGPVIEDSRCNVTDIECVWAGRFVLGATITKGETTQDTFYAVSNWQDTLYNGPYAIHLKTVKPEVRSSVEPLDPSKYSFEMVIR